MWIFLAYGIIFSVMFSLIGLICTAGMKDNWRKIIVIIIIALVLGFGWTTVMYALPECLR